MGPAIGSKRFGIVVGEAAPTDDEDDYGRRAAPLLAKWTIEVYEFARSTKQFA